MEVQYVIEYEKFDLSPYHCCSWSLSYDTLMNGAERHTKREGGTGSEKERGTKRMREGGLILNDTFKEVIRQEP